MKGIIDFRVRPPYGTIKASKLYTRKPRSEEAWGLPTAESIIRESMDLCVREMEEANIAVAVVPLRRAFGMDNRDLPGLMAAYPGKFIGCPCLDPSLALEVSLAEIDEYVVCGPCGAVMLEPGKCVTPMYTNDERIYPIYEKCEQAGITVLISHGGFIAPDMTYNNPLHIDQIARDFPKLRLVVCHGAWPYAKEMVYVSYLRENVYMMPDMYMVNCAGAQEYIQAANYMVQDKMIFGTAYPILSFAPTVAYIQQNVRPEVQEKIFRRNALCALGITE